MGSLTGLVMATAGPECADEAAARQLISAAQTLQVDILSHLVCQLAVPEEVVFARAAKFLDLPFSPAIPAEPDGVVTRPQERQLEYIGEMRSLASYVFDRLVVFIAPTAQEMIALGARRHATPAALRDICIIPPRILKETIRLRCEDYLLENARQRLARRWPLASAHLDLPLASRLGFVALLAAMIFLVAFAPFNLAPLSIALLLLIFLPNAWFRLAALFEAPNIVRLPAGELLTDAELPRYTILIPLRDEAVMVPQLAEAMEALDYPPEKLDIKFVVESVSTQTIAAVRAHQGKAHFDLVIVP